MKIVIKVGSSTLTYAETGRLNIRRIEMLCKVLSDIKNAGNEVILVSSGAISMGMGKLGLKEKPASLEGKQACASVGQCELMYTYDKLFSEYHHTVSQILLTADDFKSEHRYLNFTNTMKQLLSYGALPIINENDTVSTEEIEIGDNDTLGALVSECIHADLYVILSDIDGLYSADPNVDPNAVLIHHVNDIAAVRNAATDSVSKVGTGGMITKLNAAEIVTSQGGEMVITNGRNPEVLYEIIEGKDVGTRFSGKAE